MLSNTLRVFCLGTILLAQSAFAQTKPANDLAPIKESIQSATKLLKDGKLLECVNAAEKSTIQLQELVKSVPNNEVSDVKKIHTELAKLHELLAVQGAELTELPSWDSLLKSRKANSTKKPDEKKPEEKKPTDKSTPDKKPPEKKPATPATGSAPVSFTKDIAPWLVEQCSRCHIAAQRGGFSLATYNAIIKGSKAGVVLFPGDPIGSRLVESIETGDMPRNGNRVTPENLAKLKQWVTEGAKFDGDSPDTPLASLTNAKAPTKAEPPKIAEPTGKETVSFARDVAPILISNCNGCHYNATRVSGGLQFNMFTQILKGGDSGPIVLPGKPDESLLIRKIKGTEGARMPMGRAPLSDAQIQLVSTWIKEGATFDGQNKDAKLDQIVGQAFAAKATHSELMAKRMERASEKWKVAFPKGEPDEASNEHFHVIGNIGEEATKGLLAQANNVESQIRKLLKLSSKEPLVKGGITIYALKQRYDYSEFGKMIETRSLPAEWSSHWRKEVLDSYVAIVVDKADNKINETSLLQQITSLWIGSHEGVPRWFADGAGRQALALAVGANDLRVQPWLKRMPEAMEQMKNIKALTDGTMNDEANATIGFGIVRTMYDSKMKVQYETILKALASGSTFEQATNKVLGPIDVFLQKLLGKGK